MKLNRTVPFDGVPVFRGLALVLHDARKHGWKGRLNSADRRRGVAEKYGRKSQWWLYMAFWVWKLAGTNPANPPGRSTHELRSDGTAYRGPVGRPLAYWQLGLDVSDAEGLVRVLRKLGYKARRPYRSPSEAHHLNLYRDPVRRLRKRKLVKRFRSKAAVVVRPSKISRKGLDLIATFEGFRGEPYNDPAGFATVGFGHLISKRGVVPEDCKRSYAGHKPPLTRAQALDLLGEDVERYEKAVRAAVKVPVSQNQFDALVSFAYNLGAGALQSSTLLRKLNQRDYEGAEDEFLRWTKAGGRELQGLVRRRLAERDLFRR